MKIKAIIVYQVDLRLKGGRYSWADGKFVEIFDCTVVGIETDEGLTGYGEVCPLGPFYLPAYGPGVRAGIAELAPYLINAEASEVGKINLIMDDALLGHPYVKSGIDMACWDLLGKKTNFPVFELLGGGMETPYNSIVLLANGRQMLWLRTSLSIEQNGILNFS